MWPQILIHYTFTHDVINDVGVFLVTHLTLYVLDFKVEFSALHSNLLDLIIGKVKYSHRLSALTTDITLVSNQKGSMVDYRASEEPFNY